MTASLLYDRQGRKEFRINGMSFARSARVMSQLEAAGIVGPQDGKEKNREVLVQTFAELDKIIQAYTS